MDPNEIWKTIPPEEKLELMARASSRGIVAAAVSVVLGMTLALALNIPWIMYGMLLFTPFTYQFAVSKCWRGLRPRILLEYLAARCAARRYAFSGKTRDLIVRFIFKARLQEKFMPDQIEREIEATVNNTLETAVWVALFEDTIVLLEEEPGGAALKLSVPISEKLSIESSDNGGYTSNKELRLSFSDRSQKSFTLRSNYPGALVVFEKKTLQLVNELKKNEERSRSTAAIGATTSFLDP